MSDLCNAVKILAQEAINSQKPLEAVFGKVINESPLKINRAKAYSYKGFYYCS